VPDQAPYRNFNFVVEIDGIASAAFAEVDVPDVTIDVVEYREGTDKTSGTRKLPGRVRYANVRLRRGVSANLELYEWFDAVRRGSLVQRDVAIVLHDAEHTEVRRWHVYRAWPVKYTGPSLNAKGKDVAIEELELACEGLEIEGAG
jgi:phage tail-like protein